jgi:protein TonB
LSPGKPTLAKQTVEIRSADAAATAETHETSPSAETGDDKLLMTSKPQQAANPSNAARPQADLAPQVDSQSMNDQLTASPLIPRDIKTKAKEDAPPPPSFAAANADDLGNNGTIGALLSVQSKPAVHYAPDAPTILSAAAAEKLLIQRKAPVYPPKAWKYYVSGKVALEAIVSKTGTVKSLKVLSGKPEFEQASLEAVRNWRYKPYLVNNEPVEFQTTINLTFDANK